MPNEAGRFAFGLLSSSLDAALSGMAVTIKDERSGTYIASTSPTGNQIQIHDNGDGWYWIDNFKMSRFTVYVGPAQVPQGELSNRVPVNDEILTHMEADAPHSGHAITQDIVDHEAASDPHSGYATDAELSSLSSTVDGKEPADATILKKADVINDLTSTDTDKPLSAAQGKALQDNKIVESVDADDFEVDGNGAFSLKERSLLGGDNFLNENVSLVQNLYRLAGFLRAFSESQGGIDQRVVLVDSTSETTSGSDAPAFPVYSELGNASYKIKRRFNIPKKTGDTKLTLHFKGHVTS